MIRAFFLGLDGWLFTDSGVGYGMGGKREQGSRTPNGLC